MRYRSRRTRPALLAGGLLLAGVLAGCSGPGIVIGAGATAVAVASDERTVGRQVDDLGLEISINHRLLQKSEVLFRKVEVEANEGRVLLTGSVPTAEDRDEVSRLAWGVEGVKEVLNELQVADSSLGGYAKDSWIITQLRAKLLTDRDVLDLNYTIDSVNGIVYLIGIAQDQAELDRAIGHARTISGVQQVVSHVRLKEDPKRGT